jgi:Eukaryotic aspartyl protease
MKSLILCIQVLASLSLIVPLKEINSDRLEKLSYFKSLQLRSFLGSGIEYPLTNFMDSLYYIEVSIGTPGQVFEVIPDIISSLTWVPSYSCWSMSCFLHNLYKSSASSSFNPIGSKFAYEYGSGKIQGVYLKDILSLNTLSASIIFGQATSFEGASWMTARFDGVLSLNNYVKQLKSQDIIENQIYSIVHNDTGLQLNVGYCPGNYKYVKIVHPEHQKVLISQININNVPVEFDYMLVFDLQTPFIIVPTEFYNKIYPLVKVNSDCSNLKDLPTITLDLSGTEICLHPNDYIIKSDTNECLLGIIYLNFPISLQRAIILGGFDRHPYNICIDESKNLLGIS